MVIWSCFSAQLIHTLLTGTLILFFEIAVLLCTKFLLHQFSSCFWYCMDSFYNNRKLYVCVCVLLSIELLLYFYNVIYCDEVLQALAILLVYLSICLCCWIVLAMFRRTSWWRKMITVSTHHFWPTLVWRPRYQARRCYHNHVFDDEVISALYFSLIFYCWQH